MARLNKRIALLKYWLVFCSLSLFAVLLQELTYNFSGTILHEADDESSPSRQSCLNKIYDKIFIISIPRRIETLSITLYQLEQENIDYILWEGHSGNNNDSVHRWHRFREAVDARVRKQNATYYRSKENSAYKVQNVWFLRETQLDIMRYSQEHNLSKILIFEDDILICDPHWLQMFCEIEPHLPEWYVLTLGQNEGNPKRIRHRLTDVPHPILGEYPIKYYNRIPHSWGTFALSISFPMYSVYLQYFGTDRESKLLQYPLDNAYHSFPDEIRSHFFGIHPTLVLPDVTDSVLRSKNKVDNAQQFIFIKNRLTDQNISHFSKYWNLRFGNYSSNISREYHFNELVFNSPSKLYLHKI
eukprot:53573_1